MPNPEDSAMWQQLVIHLALISSLVLCMDVVLDRGHGLGPRRRSLVMGVLMGGAAILSMSLAEPLAPGIIFDLRAPLVACAALFGGPLGGLSAAVLAAAMRIHLGGEGTAAGLTALTIALSVGLIFHYALAGRAIRPIVIAAFALVVGATYLGGFFMVPEAIRADVIEAAALPGCTLNGIATGIVALLLWRGERQRAVAHSDMIYRQMVRALPDCLNVKDLSHRFIAANPATAELMGASSADDLIGRSDADFYPPDRAAEFMRDEDHMIAAGQPTQIEQLIRTSGDRELWVSTLKAPLYGPGDEIIGLITHCRDISEERRVLRLKREFVSTVSHELRTPLTSVRGALGLLASGKLGEIPETAAPVLAIALSNGERLVALVNDILDMEKLGTGRMSFDIRPTEVASVAARAVEEARVYDTGKDVRLTMEDRSGAARAAIDEGRLRQAVDNLLSNAIKFSPDGAEVRVTVGPGPDGGLRISVSDEGPGVPEAFVPHLFAPFEQADGTDSRNLGGTGLGLSICEAIIVRLGGTVTYEPAPSGGASFHIDLAPIAADRRPDPVAERAAA